MNFESMVTEEIVDKKVGTSENFKGGNCRCLITAADISKSSAGNEMLVINVTAKDESGEKAYLKEYLPYTERMMWKMKHFCEATNMEEEWYKKEVYPGDCLKKMFNANVILEKSDNPDFKDKWKIKYFISERKFETFKDGKKPEIKKEVENDFQMDDIPF